MGKANYADLPFNHDEEPIRLFKSDFLEFFTHIHPAVVPIIWLPVAAYFLSRPIANQALGAGQIVAALILGLVNTLIRPLLILLTLPATVLTLGLFIFVINALLFWFVASFVEGFHVAGFWSAFFGWLVYALVSWAASALVFGERRVVVRREDR